MTQTLLKSYFSELSRVFGEVSAYVAMARDAIAAGDVSYAEHLLEEAQRLSKEFYDKMKDESNT